MKTEAIERAIGVLDESDKIIQEEHTFYGVVLSKWAKQAYAELAALKEENERLRAFRAVAPLPEWFRERTSAHDDWLKDYAEKHATALREKGDE